jgi:hypothetical protein
MKLIGKHKDYYDYLVSKYGYDETRVYDRRGDNYHFYSSHHLLSICGTYYPIVEEKGVMIFDSTNSRLDWSDKLFIQKWKGKQSKQNIIHRSPILYCNNWDGQYDNYGYTCAPPLLKHFGIPSIIDADTMYQMIYNFLGWLKDNPEPPNNQTDKEKIRAAGFDTKTSFRPKIKN